MVAKPSQGAKQKRTRISQSEIPNMPLEPALRIARGIWDNFAGKGSAPHNVAMAIDLSPTSGTWRNLCGSSAAYGLTEGGYAAQEIVLTPLGRRIVAPTSEGDDAIALQEAALKPRVPSEFFTQFDRAKFPRDDIAANLLIEKGIPKKRAADLVQLLKDNGTFVGFIKETKTGPFVSLDVPTSAETMTNDRMNDNFNDEHVENEDSLGESVREINSPAVTTPSTRAIGVAENNRVFITHGKNKEILEQIKEVVELGGFEPVVSIQSETAAKPISDKVMDEMRSCSAAVIHVGSEGTFTDSNGDELPHLNSNVLIEIGAAMALYKGRFILIVEDGVVLPSNLKGMYESRYSGSAIEFKAGMKILKALRGLQQNNS